MGLLLELDGDMEYISSQAPLSGTSVPNGSSVKAFGSAQENGAADFVRVPDVTGMKQEQAAAALEEKGLVAEFSGEGRAAHQSEPAGSQVARGTKVTVEME